MLKKLLGKKIHTLHLQLNWADFKGRLNGKRCRHAWPFRFLAVMAQHCELLVAHHIGESASGGGVNAHTKHRVAHMGLAAVKWATTAQQFSIQNHSAKNLFKFN
ncbi:MAG: hypothetical protein JZU60_03005 [Ilumatobacteraceae bacterium]|jgi:hypothetical protein|nr:hypothetical protein [Ilumatobacteraceae bacterium]